METRTITFLITVGSYFPKPQYEGHTVFPKGGEQVTKVIDFETDGKDIMKDAFSALDKEFSGETYHIWYWWHNLGE